MFVLSIRILRVGMSDNSSRNTTGRYAQHLMSLCLATLELRYKQNPQTLTQDIANVFVDVLLGVLTHLDMLSVLKVKLRFLGSGQ